MFQMFPTLTETESRSPLYSRTFVTETGEQVEFTHSGDRVIVRWDENQQFIIVHNNGRTEQYDHRPVYGPRFVRRSMPVRTRSEGRVHFDATGEYCGRY